MRWRVEQYYCRNHWCGSDNKFQGDVSCHWSLVWSRVWLLPSVSLPYPHWPQQLYHYTIRDHPYSCARTKMVIRQNACVCMYGRGIMKNAFSFFKTFSTTFCRTLTGMNYWHFDLSTNAHSALLCRVYVLFVFWQDHPPVHGLNERVIFVMFSNGQATNIELEKESFQAALVTHCNWWPLTQFGWSLMFRNRQHSFN